MRYLYYIAGILIVFSGLAAYGLIDTRVEISKPVLVINDRIITQPEIEKRLEAKPYYMTRDEYFNSIITEQILIQEAMRQEINKEESFRQSVEQYYEQSLIKILLDRKLNSLEVNVTANEIDRFRQLSQSRVIISKFGYKSIDDAVKGTHQTPQKIESDFVDISDDLKFILLTLEKGHLSSPVESGMGVLVYRLDDILPTPTSGTRQKDESQVKAFIQDKKRELLMDVWTRQLKESANIWREKMSQTGPYKRKIFFINKELQGKFIFNYFILLTLGSLLFVGIFSFFSSNTLSIVYENYHLRLGTTPGILFKNILSTQWLFIVIGGIFICVITLRLTHRVAGPFYRFERGLDQMIEGDVSKTIVLRQKDEGKELAEKINRFNSKLSEQLVKIGDLNSKIGISAQSLETQIAEGETKEISRLVETINQNQKNIETVLHEYTLNTRSRA